MTILALLALALILAFHWREIVVAVLHVALVAAAMVYDKAKGI